MSGRHLSALVILLGVVHGCGQPPPPPLKSTEPVGVQLLRVEPQLKDQRFNALLTFESPSDAIFMNVAPSPAKFDAHAHTGSAGLMLPPKTQRAEVKLASLLGHRPFPGTWTLAGAYFFSEAPVGVTVSYGSSGTPISKRTVKLTPSRWTPVFLDIARLAGAQPKTAGWEKTNPETAPPIAPLVFTFDNNGSDPIWCDDVAIIDNRQTLVGDPDATSLDSGWSIERRGFYLFGNAPGKFQFMLLTSEGAADGWSIEETNEMRARFSSTGKSKALTVYHDGRAYWDGEFKPMANLGEWEEDFRSEHLAPAQIVVEDESTGRVERTTKGDANNDGYNEIRGAYEVSASGARLEVKLVPRSAALLHPVIEVAGLPQGKVLVTVEGRLVDAPLRLPNGNVLVELPVRIDRTTTINLRLQ